MKPETKYCLHCGKLFTTYARAKYCPECTENAGPAAGILQQQ